MRLGETKSWRNALSCFLKPISQPQTLAVATKTDGSANTNSKIKVIKTMIRISRRILDSPNNAWRLTKICKLTFLAKFANYEKLHPYLCI